MTVVRINAIEVQPGSEAELERRFAARMGALEGTPGFLGFDLLRPTAGEERYFVLSRWADAAAFEAWRQAGAPAAHAGPPGRAPVSRGASLLEFDVVDLSGVAPGPVAT